MRDRRPAKISMSFTGSSSLSISSFFKVHCQNGGCHSPRDALTCEEVNNSMNPCLMNDATSCSSLSQLPILSFMLEMRFLLIHTSVELWKKVVFLSPSTTQVMRAFMLQNSASSLEISKSSALRVFSRSTRNLLGLTPNAVWMPWSLAHILLLRWKIFPNWSLFHALALEVKKEMALGRVTGLTYASLTIPGKVGWESHIGLINISYLSLQHEN